MHRMIKHPLIIRQLFIPNLPNKANHNNNKLKPIQHHNKEDNRALIPRNNNQAPSTPLVPTLPNSPPNDPRLNKVI